MDRGFTRRGFACFGFTDRNGHGCSVQDSSIATEACLWLGVDQPYVKVMGPNGWADVPLPPGVSIYGRMHLTQEQVRELLPILERFAETGSIVGR